MGETVNLVLAQYRSVISGETCLHLVRREKRSDFEAVLSDWATTISDLGEASRKAIAKHGPPSPDPSN